MSTAFKFIYSFLNSFVPHNFFSEALTGFRHEAGCSDTVSRSSRDTCQMSGSTEAAAVGGLRSGLALTDSSGGISTGISQTEQKLWARGGVRGRHCQLVTLPLPLATPTMSFLGPTPKERCIWIETSHVWWGLDHGWHTVSGRHHAGCPVQSCSETAGLGAAWGPRQAGAPPRGPGSYRSRAKPLDSTLVLLQRWSIKHTALEIFKASLQKHFWVQWTLIH